MGTRVERSGQELRIRDQRGRVAVVPLRGRSHVVGWKTITRDGQEQVEEVRLSCLHWHRLRKPKPLGLDPWAWLERSYRCAACGSVAGMQRLVNGTRLEQAQNQQREQTQHLREVLPDVVADPPRAEAMVLFIEAALEARALPARDPRSEQVYERINRQAMLAGLLPSYRPEDDWGHRA